MNPKFGKATFVLQDQLLKHLVSPLHPIFNRMKFLVYLMQNLGLYFIVFTLFILNDDVEETLTSRWKTKKTFQLSELKVHKHQ